MELAAVVPLISGQDGRYILLVPCCLLFHLTISLSQGGGNLCSQSQEGVRGPTERQGEELLPSSVVGCIEELQTISLFFSPPPVLSLPSSPPSSGPPLLPLSSPSLPLLPLLVLLSSPCPLPPFLSSLFWSSSPPPVLSLPSSPPSHASETVLCMQCAGTRSPASSTLTRR